MMCCYYPTTTVAIDDDVDFLRVMTQHLGIADCIPYSSPNQAIEDLSPQKPFQRIQSRIFKTRVVSDSNAMPDEHAFTIDLHKLHEEIYSRERFKDTSVLIIDYHMAEKSGIEVCEALHSHPAKKILLTGGVDKEKIAIDAFNKGIIHRFINKSEPNFPTKLQNAISILKEAYFRDLTASFLPYISPSSITLLQNPAYINFLRNLQSQFNAVEYYAFDTTGSSILFNTAGNPVWVVIKHESELNNYGKLADDHDADKEIIQSLIMKKKLPFFFTDDDYQCNVSEWDKFLFQAHPLPGLNNYYYAVIEGNIRNNLKKEKIIPYKISTQK